MKILPANMYLVSVGNLCEQGVLCFMLLAPTCDRSHSPKKGKSVRETLAECVSSKKVIDSPG
jgi:hypothetical protein